VAFVKIIDDSTSGRGMPWGRVLEVDEKIAGELVTQGKAVRYARVRFDAASGPYNAGETAALPQAEADILIGAKRARAV
jgi:hypothetical protein